jgi:hypothetical protein
VRRARPGTPGSPSATVARHGVESWPWPLRLAIPGVDLAARAAVLGALALVSGAALRLLWASRHWPLVHDAPLMHYVAWRLLGGAIPYRDLFDMNFPGVYLVHMLVLSLLGPGDLAFRVFDVSVLLLVTAGLVAAVRPFGPGGGFAAAALFALYHVSGGPWLAGQRELLLAAALAWAAAGVVRAVESPGRGPAALGAAALALGTAVWLKPHAAVLAPVLVVVAWRRSDRGRALLLVGLGLGLPAGGALGWLVARGALGAFVDVVAGYLIPLYSRVGRTAVTAELAHRDYGALVLGGLAAWAALGAAGLLRAGRRAGLAVLAGGAAYGAFHFWGQGRGWEYHFYPLALFAAALGGAGLAAALRDRRRGRAAALAGVLAITAGALWVRGERNLDPAWIRVKLDTVARVADALRPAVLAGGTVQVLDTTEGGIHALLRLGARQPTRFLYDFPFHHDVHHAYIRARRAELMAQLRAHPPAAVVLFPNGWPSGGFERVARFPELAAWLEAEYRLAEAADGYRLYRPRAGIAGGPAGAGAGG